MSDSQVSDLPSSSTEQKQSPIMTSPGAKLAEYREERGWTIDQVARQLNLAPRQIAAIERDDYPALPGMASVRGFVRAYAKLLKVDPTPLVASLGGETLLATNTIVPRKSLAEPFSETRLPSLGEQKQGVSSKWMIVLLLVLLMGVAFWATQQGSGLVVAPVAEPAKSELLPEAPAEAAMPQAADPTVGATSAAPAVEESNLAVTPTTTPTTPTPVESAAVTPAQPVSNGKNALVLNASQDSWLEIRRASNGSVIISRIMKAGETETFEVTEPVSLVVGNVAGVEATLRGADLDLKSRDTSNVGRLSLK